MSSGTSNPLDHVPAAMAPAGVTSNLIDPPSKAHTLTVLDSIFFSAMGVAVLIRFYVRTRTTKNWGWDDAACVVAALGSLSHTLVYVEAVKYGFGRHLWDIPASWLINHLQVFSSNGVTYPVTIFFTKLCILLFYIRIFGINRSLKWTVAILSVVLALFYTAMVALAIASFVLCNDVAEASRPFCIEYSGPNVLLNASFNVATDIILLLIPFPLLLKLKTGLKQKIRYTAVFGAGIAAVAASIVRLVEFAVNYHNPDVLWVQATNAMFTTVEINIGIIITCAPTLSTFYRHAVDYVQTTTIAIKTRLLTPKGSTYSLGEHLGSSGTLPAEQGPTAERRGANQHLELQEGTLFSDQSVTRGSAEVGR